MKLIFFVILQFPAYIYFSLVFNTDMLSEIFRRFIMVGLSRQQTKKALGPRILNLLEWQIG